MPYLIAALAVIAYLALCIGIGLFLGFSDRKARTEAIDRFFEED